MFSSLGVITAFFAGFFTLPVLYALGAFSLFFVATYVESTILGLLFVVIVAGVLTWAGVGVHHIFVAYPLWNTIIATIATIVAYFPTGYSWGIHFKLPRSARKDAEAVKAKIEELKPDFIARCKEYMKATDASEFFVKVPLVEKVVKNNNNRGYEDERRGQNVSTELQVTLLADLDKGVIPDALEETFKKYLAGRRIMKTGAWRYKDRIFSWIIFWPWSVLGYLATEFLYDLLMDFCAWLKRQWLKVWRYIVSIVTRVIDKAYADAGIAHLIEEEKKH